MTRLAITLCAAIFVFPTTGFSKADASHKKGAQASEFLSATEGQEIKERVRHTEGLLEKMEAEMDVLREQSKLVIQRTQLGFLDQFYARVGMTLINPRIRTLSFRADPGVGALAGIGHYIGRNHVIELSFNWDLYPALTLCYRLEFHNATPPITWGPVIGYKTKAFDAQPFDNFMDSPDQVLNSFFVFGGIIGFPMGRALLSVELLYLTHRQSFFFTIVGIHFFF